LSAEEAFLSVAPQALEVGIVPRIDEYITNKQFDIMTRNLEKIGFFAFLGRDAVEKPWTAFTNITDTILDADTTPNDNHPEAVDAVIDFSDRAGRDRFHTASGILLAGIHGYEEMPWLRPSGKDTLVAENFRYADLSTIGRTKTALFRREQQRLGPNLRLLQAQTLDEIETTGVKPHTPKELRERMAYQRGALDGRLGIEKPGETPVTSGHVSILGAAMRRCLQEREVEKVTIQRHRENRPYSEYKTHFFTKYGSTVPLSGSSLPKALGEQVLSRYGELSKPYRERDFVKAAEDFWDIVTGFAATQTIGSGVRAIGTIAAATFTAFSSKYSDNRRKNNQSRVTLL
jgi:hypothetical protein